MKVQETSLVLVDMSVSLEQCEKGCLKNCSCTAYTSADESGGGIGSLTWYDDLLVTRTFSDIR